MARELSDNGADDEMSPAAQRTGSQPDQSRKIRQLRSLSLVPHRLTQAERRFRIAELAYRKAEQRGFAPGGELEDWLAAESEVDTLAGARRGD